MTPSEYSAELDKRLTSFEKAKDLFFCASKVVASMSNRIWVEGLNANLKSHEALGKDYAVYSAGYARKRKKAGREVGFVNLRFEGRLLTDFANSLQKEGNGYVAGTRNAENSKKVDYLIDLYGTATFKPSKQDKDFYNKCMMEALIEKINS